jgi:hypothetical protein
MMVSEAQVLYYMNGGYIDNNVRRMHTTVGGMVYFKNSANMHRTNIALK